MALVQCRDSDGWQWTSQLRDFDLSLCIEEGVILTSFLTILIVMALVRIGLLSYAPWRDVSRNGRWRLWAKLVRFLRLFALRMLSPFPDTPWSRFLDQSNHPLIYHHRPDQHSRPFTSCTRTSRTPPCLVLDPFQPS